jgi:TolB-like protein/Tfp pilus assembly protein PilF
LWIAVAPFSSRGGDDESALAEGLSEDIAAGLARFPYLKVAATPDRARYVVEGAVRRLGSTVRVAVDLKDVQSGVQIWGEKYDRAGAGSNLFVVQDEIAARVIATVGDGNGVLVQSMVGGLRGLPLHELSIDELVLRAVPFAYQQRPDENAALIDAFESALAREPAHAEGWACLASLYRAAQLHVGTGIEDAVERQRQAAQRAVDLDPGCQGGWESLASAAFFVHDAAAFRAAAERAIAINQLNGNVAAFMSHLIAYSGDWSRGLEILDRTLALGTKHPGWYHFMPFVNHYRLGELEQAWQAVKRVNMPEYPWTLLSLAVTAVELGHWDEARAAIASVRKHVPKFLDAEVVRAEWGRMVWDEALVARFVSSYRKALDHDAGRRDVQTSERPASGQRPALSSIAVLPFVNLSADPENEYFGDGLAEEILNALTNVPGVTVIARTSAFAFKGQTGDVRKIGEALGVTTVLEGSVRRSAARVRVGAQLVDATTGAHLWSQRYDREMTDIFTVQDDIAQAIAVALRGTFAAALQGRRYTPGVPAYESFLKGRAQLIHFTPDSWERARTSFEEAIALDPDYAEPHGELALGYFICGMHGIAAMRDVAPFIGAGATRALELDPSNEQPRFVLGGLALAHDYDWAAARAHFEASMKSPNVPAHARWIYASLYLRALGRFEESSAEMRRAVEQDPLNATWHGILGAHLADAGRVEEGLKAVIRANEIEPNNYVSVHLMGEVQWVLGRYDEALEAFQRAYALAPWFAISAGRLAVALRRAGRDAEADRVLAMMGDNPRPRWGRVLYDIYVGALDAAADAYEGMIAERDPFALVYASSEPTRPLLWAHPRWPALAAMMNLPTERR